jgi:glycosyltransferase involved in cell wall biosynthesis
MKVLQVIDTLKVGGAERLMVTLSNLLFQNNINVTVLIIVEKGELIKDLNPQIKCLFLRRKKRFDLAAMKSFAEILSKYDIIHTHLKHNFRYTILVAKLFNIKSTNIIFHDHSHNLTFSKFSYSNIKNLFFKNILKPKFYIGVSEYNCRWAINELKISKSNCFLLENIIQKQEIKDSNITKKGIVLVSNISRIKNIEFAIKLIKQLDEELTIYGKVIDKSYFNKINNLIDSFGLTQKVTFITGCTNIQPELHKYKYALHTSFKETGPLVLIEYLSQGLPFLSFSTGQVFNLIGNKTPHFFVSNFEIKEWKVKINELSLVSKDTILGLYNNFFNTDKYIAKCLKIYQIILNS